MGVSDIAVTALTVVATVKGNQLTITTSDPRSGALPNIALDHVDIYASQTDTFASATVVAQGTLRALHADAGEEQTWYYWGIPYDKLGSAGTRYPSGATGGVACKSLGQAGLAFGLSNGKLVADTHSTDATVATNALRISIKTIAGNDPSASDPVYLAFAGQTAGVGSYRIIPITAAFSFTISSGSTLGTSDNIPFRIWVVVFDDAGTLRLGVIVCSNGGALIYPLASDGFSSSTAEGGAGAADSVAVIYTATAVSSKPFRILGTLDFQSGQAAAGSWASAPTPVRLFGPGSHIPGDVVFDFGNANTGGGSGSTTTPLDNTIPQQATEGNGTNFGVQLTPISPINFMDFDVVFNVVYSVASPLIGAMYRDSTANAFATCWGYAAGADLPTQIVFRRRVQAADAAQRTYNFKIGGSNAGTLRICTTSGGAALGGTLQDFYGIKEIMG